MSETCPKCGESPMTRGDILEFWNCGSNRQIVSGRFAQSLECRVGELEKQLAMITAHKEDFGRKVNEAAVRECKWLALLGLLPEDDLGKAIEACVAAVREAIVAIDEAYVKTGHIKVAKTSEQRLRLEAAINNRKY